MMKFMSVAWGEFLLPMLRRPKRVQVAALCYRGKGPDKEVLLVTSRGSGRWIIPKGWPIPGKNSADAARQEAWEEAGVSNGKVGAKAIGRYTYNKELSTGWSIPVETMVYPLNVEDLSEQFPEAHQRKRKWTSAADAANLVQEPELKQILQHL